MVFIKEVKPMFIVLSETHITEQIEDSELNISGYSAIRCNSHSRHTGGVILYVAKYVKFKIVVNENLDNEVWLLSVELHSKKNIIIHGLYKSPACSDRKFLKYLDNYVNSLVSSKTHIMVGDFNIDMHCTTDSYYSRSLKTYISDWGMKQLIKDYTRVTKSSRTLIDLVITNDYKVLGIVTDKYKIGDHNTIEIKVEEEEVPEIINNFKCFRYTNSDLEQYLSSLTMNNVDLSLNLDILTK